MGGAVFSGVPLLAVWRAGIVWSDGVPTAQEPRAPCPPASLVHYYHTCILAQGLCCAPAGFAFIEAGSMCQ